MLRERFLVQGVGRAGVALHGLLSIFEQSWLLGAVLAAVWTIYSSPRAEVIFLQWCRMPVIRYGRRCGI
jgi:hypothetical protein